MVPRACDGRQHTWMAPERVSADRRAAITTIASSTTTSTSRPKIWASAAMVILVPARSAAESDVVAGGKQLGLSAAQIVPRIGGVAAGGLGRFIGRPGLGDVDLVGQLGVFGEDRHA